MSSVVQRLDEMQKPAMLQHLSELSPDELRLRFGSPMNEQTLQRYVESIDFGRDQLFGIYGSERRLVAMAHVAVDPAKHCAELGLSVAPDQRRRGQGETLLRRAVLHASNSGARVIYMQCLRENEPMMRLARNAGFVVIPDGTEADASKSVASSPGSFLREFLYDKIALADHALQHQIESDQASFESR
ncbi:MAG: GNAT family N-acetyltransferase [Burkholderiales bacterium]|nr:GNAT family N-acetyltransferase [Burkholderiales bacterium]